MKTLIVVPSNRPERIKIFLEAWAPYWFTDDKDIELLLIEDVKEPQIEDIPYPNVHHFSHQNIDNDLGKRGDCIDRFSPAVRSYGIWKAGTWDPKPDMIFTTDDDCLPLDYEPIMFHWNILQFPVITEWWKNSLDYLRGFPYEIRAGHKPVLNHGLVEGIPDIDAITQLHRPNLIHHEVYENEDVPIGAFFPMSIQNVAFRPELAPIMYLSRLPEGMNRWSDIWCGLIMKRICDVRGWPVCNGNPCLRHDRASNVWANLKQEWAGYEINERLWKVIANIEIEGGDILEDYRAIARGIKKAVPELGIMCDSMMEWAKLW